MAAIKNITAREILDSRGNPTVEAIVTLEDGCLGIASCPSGASTGTHEAVELDDKKKAVENITNIITPKVVGFEATNQKGIDQIMLDLDGTPTKARLGANAILPVSIAVCKAAASSKKLPLYSYIAKLAMRQFNNETMLPIPVFNILNGGLHAGRNIDFQEFMVIPGKNNSFSSSLQLGALLYHLLKKTLSSKNLSTLVGDEGGFAPALASNIDALDLLGETVLLAGLELGKDVTFGIDIASNTFYEGTTYKIKENPNPLSSNELIAYYKSLADEYKLSYLEDPLSEDDFDAWSRLTSEITKKTLIVGDDLTVTNPDRLEAAIEKKAITAIIIKPNQIGTLTESISVVQKAKQAQIATIASHRSGETNDTFIADFAVGVGTDFVKFGAPARGERVAKYNRLLAIEQEISL